MVSDGLSVMYTDTHNIDSKGENIENLTLMLTKSHTWQKIESQLHMYSSNLLVNQLDICSTYNEKIICKVNCYKYLHEMQ